MTDDSSSAETRAGIGAGLALLCGGTVAIGAAYAAAIVLGEAPSWAPWALVFGAAATPVGLFVIGAATRGVLTRGLGVVLGALFLLLFGSFSGALALAPDEGPGGRLLFGLPLRLAIVFYGVGFVPLVALPVVFGLTFGDRARSARGKP